MVFAEPVILLRDKPDKCTRRRKSHDEEESAVGMADDGAEGPWSSSGLVWPHYSCNEPAWLGHWPLGVSLKKREAQGKGSADKVQVEALPFSI